MSWLSFWDFGRDWHVRLSLQSLVAYFWYILTPLELWVMREMLYSLYKLKWLFRYVLSLATFSGEDCYVSSPYRVKVAHLICPGTKSPPTPSTLEEGTSSVPDLIYPGPFSWVWVVREVLNSLYWVGCTWCVKFWSLFIELIAWPEIP